MQAAAVLGYRGETVFNSRDKEALPISLERTKKARSPLFAAIPRRQSTRTEFDGSPLSKEESRLLETAGSAGGVRAHLLTDKRAMENVLEFVVHGNAAQMGDPALVLELKGWLRFNGRQAVKTGDGLFSGLYGTPTAPSWLGNLMFDVFFTETPENDKYARHVRSSAGIAVSVSDLEDKNRWIEGGRAFQRFALHATAMDARTTCLNQPVEVASLRPQLAKSTGIASGRPDLVIRFGRGPEMPWSLRGPFHALLL